MVPGDRPLTLNLAFSLENWFVLAVSEWLIDSRKNVIFSIQSCLHYEGARSLPVVIFFLFANNHDLSLTFPDGIFEVAG